MILIGFNALSDDGSRLWLRYEAVDASLHGQLKQSIETVDADIADPTLKIAADELQRAMAGFTGIDLPLVISIESNSVVSS